VQPIKRCQDGTNNCSYICLYQINLRQYICECYQGFNGDGYNCTSELPLETTNVTGAINGSIVMNPMEL